MSSLPPSSTPPAGDDSLPESQLPAAAGTTESPPVAAADSDSAPESAPAAAATGPAQEDCGPQLKQLYPALFSNPPKPLKLRIQADIQARSPGQFTKPQLSAFLRRYTGSHGYLNAIVKATHRFDLDGNPGDELSDEHRQAAVDELARRRANTQARRALEDEQRFNRSVLLRDFEVTKLDKPGFAALKGVPEGELDGLLERARKEAAEAPPAAARPDRRGPPNRGSRPESQDRGPRGPRPPREPRAESAPATVEADADGSAPAAPAPRSDAPRGPQGDAPRGPRPAGARGPRSEAPRGPQGARPDERGPRGPRPDAPRGPRPDGQRGPRPDGSPGARADASRGPRNDRPRDDRPRGPRPDERPSRPNVSSSPAAPTAMELAFSALRGGKTNK